MGWKKRIIPFLLALLLVLSAGCASSNQAESPVPEQPSAEQHQVQPGSEPGEPPGKKGIQPINRFSGVG